MTRPQKRGEARPVCSGRPACVVQATCHYTHCVLFIEWQPAVVDSTHMKLNLPSESDHQRKILTKSFHKILPIVHMKGLPVPEEFLFSHLDSCYGSCDQMRPHTEECVGFVNEPRGGALGESGEGPQSHSPYGSAQVQTSSAPAIRVSVTILQPPVDVQVV